jgi:putative methyltransferase (TIGR04325 family)
MPTFVRRGLSSGVALARHLGLYPYGFSGNYSSWSDALAAAGGDYQARSIVVCNVDSTTKFVSQLRSAPDDHPTTRKISDAVTQTRSTKQACRVIDFGGALGRHYFGVRSVLPPALRLEWTVWETPAMCRAGISHFRSDELTFVAAAEQLDENYDVGIASGSLQYVEQPWITLRLLLSKVALLVVDRLPLIDGTTDRLTIQRVPPWLYRGCYPAWFLGRESWFHEVGRHVGETWILPEQVWLDGNSIADSGYIIRPSS